MLCIIHYILTFSNRLKIIQTPLTKTKSGPGAKFVYTSIGDIESSLLGLMANDENCAVSEDEEEDDEEQKVEVADESNKEAGVMPSDIAIEPEAEVPSTNAVSDMPEEVFITSEVFCKTDHGVNVLLLHHLRGHYDINLHLTKEKESKRGAIDWIN